MNTGCFSDVGIVKGLRFFPPQVGLLQFVWTQSSVKCWYFSDFGCFWVGYCTHIYIYRYHVCKHVLLLWLFVLGHFSRIDCTTLYQLCCNLWCDMFPYAHGNDLFYIQYIICLCLQACFFCSAWFDKCHFPHLYARTNGFQSELALQRSRMLWKVVISLELQHVRKDESINKPVQWLIDAFLIYCRFTCHALI